MADRACGRCSASVGADARFCEMCGHALGRQCAACGYTSQGKALFCGGCGKQLDDAASSVSARSVPPSVEGRRVVTILFADLSGYTQLSSELDAEELHRVVQAFFDRLEGIVTGLGGTVERYIGDAVMCIFGAPVARHDDGLRAVRAGLEIQAAMPGLSREMGRELKTTVGLANGEVVMMGSRANYAGEVTVVGKSVNLAARIDSLAKAGEVLITSALYKQIEGRVDAEDWGMHRFKGIDKPVRLWRVHGLKLDVHGDLSTFAGRKEEMEQLHGLLHRAEREGVGSFAVIRGEAGIGKTRLVEEVLQLARTRGFGVHRSVFLDFGLDKRSQGFSGLIASILGVLSGDGPEIILQRIRDAVQNAVVPEHLGPLLNELLYMEHSTESRRVLDGMSPDVRELRTRLCIQEAIRSTSNGLPTLLVLEDIHWARPREMDRLREVVQSALECPVVIMVATRLVGDPITADFLSPLPRAQLVRLTLSGLSASDMKAMAGIYTELEDQVVQQCMLRADGNPLFFAQLLQHSAEHSFMGVPDTVRSLILSRLDRLGPPHRWALQVASALGQRWQLAALRFVLEDPVFNPDLLTMLGLIRQEGGDFSFSHALVRDGAYESLLKRHAADIHIRAAEWYQGRDRSLWAQHLDRGGSDSAASAYLLSAKDDVDSGRIEDATAQLERVGELRPSLSDRVSLQLLWGRLKRRSGEIPASLEAFRVAISLADKPSDRCLAWIGLASGMRLSDDLDGALEVLGHAQRVAEQLQMNAARARIHYLRGSLLFPKADIDGCLAEHQQALKFSRAGDDALCEAEALSGLGDAYYASGQMQAAHKYFQQCMEKCHAHGFGRLESANRFMVGTVRIYLHEMHEALNDALESASLAVSVGNQRAEIVSRLTAGWVLISMARWDEVERETTLGLDTVRAIGANRFRPFLRESEARVAWYQGDAALARRIMRGSVQEVRDLGMERFIGPWLLGTLAMVDPDARESALTEGERWLEEGAVGHNHFHFRYHAIEACLDEDDLEAVERHAEALKSFTSAQPNPWSDFQIERARLLVAARRGDVQVQALQQLRATGRDAGLVTELRRLDAWLRDGIPA